MSNPCRLCTDWYCCRGACVDKAKHLKQLKRVAEVKKLVVDVNKHGIRRERIV
jgi:hypothetical protein